MRKIATIIAATACVAALSACASRQPVDTTPPAPPQQTAPAPTPAPTPPPAPVRQGPVAGSLEDFRVTVGDRVFFGYDRFDLTPEAQSTLQRQATWLRTYPSTRILVAGSADERGTREYNLALGARRAASVKEYLVNLGVPASRVETTSYGKERPLDPRSTEEAWALNRNAHTQIVSGQIS
jgi:peptidoglycan-associated lipoprotein